MLDGSTPSRLGAGSLQLVKLASSDRDDLGIVPWGPIPTQAERLRPLSSALLWLITGCSDCRCAQHVHSLFVAALVMRRFFAALLSPHRRFATVLFAFDPAHVIPIV